MSEPFTDEDLTAINDALITVKKAKEVARKAKQAGFDVDEQTKAIEAGEKRLLGIKSAFFPNK